MNTLDLHAVGKLIFGTGVFLCVAGAVLMALQRLPHVGRMPGDILIRKEHLTIYVPITTCLILSVVLSLLFHLFNKK